MSQTTEMPPTYLRCTAEEGSCPLRDTCLRSKVHREADYTSEYGNRGLSVVNLWNAALKPLTSECQMYRKAEAKRFAKGFSRLFDPVPRGVYPTVQAQVERVFSNRLYYFQCNKGTRLTSPEEQQRIARIFEKNGITAAPEYDKIVEVYDYSE